MKKDTTCAEILPGYKDQLEPKGKEKTMKKFWPWTRDLLLTFAISFVLFGVVFNITIVSGTSMMPTLRDGTVVIGLRLLPAPERGDIISFKTAGFGGGTKLIKRVIGVEGDVINIDLETGVVTVNGEALEEDYVAATTLIDYGTQFPVTVEPGCVFVMGDNRNNSVDSRSPEVGQIPIEDIISRYLFAIQL